MKQRRNNLWFYLGIALFILTVGYLIWRRRSTIEAFADNVAIVTWKQSGFNTAKNATVSSDGAIYAVDSQNNLFAYRNGQWAQMTGSLTFLKAKTADEIVGLENRSFVVYRTTNATSSNPTWSRLNASRFDTVSVGYDGTIWATVLPVNGTWGVYSYDNNGNWQRMPGGLKQVAVRNSTEVWGVGPDFSVWRWQDGIWKSIDGGALNQIAIGSDGDVWGIDVNSTLWHRTSKGDWQKATGKYQSVDVKDGNSIVAVDSSGNVLLGSVQAFGSVTDPVESPFMIAAYSGGNATYSDDQKSAVGWAELVVNDIPILGNSTASKQQAKNGLNTIILNDSGNPITIDSFDTGTDPSASDAFARKLQSVTTVSSKALPVNLYGAFVELVQNGIAANAGKGPLSPDGTSNPGPNYSLDFQSHLIYTGTAFAGFYEAQIAPGVYTFTVTYSGDGSFDIATSGADAGLLDVTLNATSVPQTYTTNVTFKSTGSQRLMFKCNTAKTITVQNPALSKNDDTVYPPSMMIILVHGDAATNLNATAITALQNLGSNNFRSLKSGGSFAFVFDIKNGRVLADSIDNAGHVKFYSEGRNPVIDSSFLSDDSKSMWLTHGSSIVKYDIDNGKLLSSATLDASGLPVPFNTRIDTVLEKDSGKSLLLTRGKFWILVGPDIKTVLSGPDVIGSGVFPINVEPFVRGLDSSCASPDGNYYIFRRANFAKVSADWKSISSQGLLGASGSEFAGLPKAFTKIIHAAFLSGSNLGLVSYDKLLFYNPNTAKVVEGPVSLLSDTRFANLPVSYKIGSTGVPKPFANHTLFSGQLLKNFDITVSAGQPNFPGWSPDSFTKLNSNLTYNWIPPPIKTSSFVSLYPDVVKTYGSATNDLLTAYAKFSDTAGWDVPRYGGNTVSFTLVDPKQSSWRSHEDSSSGKGFKNAALRGGGYYTLSIWAVTEDTGLSVGAYTGSPETSALDPKSTVNLAPISISADKDWQLLTWSFHNPPKSLAQDVSFTLSQVSTANNLHTLYGPVLKASVSTPDKNYLRELLNLSYFYLSFSSSSQKLGYDGTSLYTCSDCKSINGVFGANERWCLYKGKYPNTFLLSSFSQFQKGPLNLSNNNGSLGVSTEDGAAQSWCFIKDNADLVYLINYDSDVVLTCSADGKATLLTAPLTVSDLKAHAWNVQLEQKYESFDLYPKQIYIEASFARDADSSPEVFLFRRGVMCSVNVVQPDLLTTPVAMSDHSMFQMLPQPFKNHVDSAFLLSGSDVLLFEKDSFILWDVQTGDVSKRGNKVSRLGPGGDALFHRLPPPFNKHIDASFKLNATNVVLISESKWIAWDLTAGTPTTDPALLSTGIFANVDDAFRKSVDSAVEMPGKPGTAVLFTGGEYLVFDFNTGKTIEGPAVLGPAGDRFSLVIPPFIPNHDETCQIYSDIIIKNTENPKAPCSEDPNRQFPWQTQCLFTLPTCEAAGGVWNDATGCGTAISKGATPLKVIDQGVRKQYTDKYLKECKTVSEAQYYDMKQLEKAKYDKATADYAAEQAAKQFSLNRISVTQKNIDALNQQLIGLQLELTKDTEKACKPNVVCLKSAKGRGTTKQVPLGCQRDVVQAILSKDTITQDDAQTILNIIKKANIINDYPIEKHPDYQNYLKTSNVKACPSVKRKTIQDFALTDFPSLKDYISGDKLLPVNTRAQSNGGISSVSANSQVPSTTNVSSVALQSNSLSQSDGSKLISNSTDTQMSSTNPVSKSSQSVSQGTVPTTSGIITNSAAGTLQTNLPNTSSAYTISKDGSLQKVPYGPNAAVSPNKYQVDPNLWGLPTVDKSKVDPSEVKSYLSFVDQVLLSSSSPYASPYFTQ